ncbi:hypothetical protein [Streptomyces cinereospinus]|uniref:Flp pilus assembly protein RcpC/CpaB domain-containing protein n=1 Tax=Streptomyces cinereospinus TaxID=285561 RepID=A0ABV5N5S1_9ACTN
MSLAASSVPPAQPLPGPRSPLPLPLGTDAPPTCQVPLFAPVRVRGGRFRLRRFVRQRRRALAAALVITAVALVAAGPRAPADTRPGDRARGHPVADRAPERRAVRPVSAPVRIADAATVRLLRPGDRVDVVAATESVTGGAAEVVARGALVTEVPEPPAGEAVGGALVVLSVPRATAARLAGASATARLAVTVC